MATIDKDLLLDKIDRLLKLHDYAREDWFANTIHNTVWDAPEIETDGETIYRADAIEAMEARIKWFNGDAIEDRCKRDAFIQALDALSALPSAETVQVVRCKNCKHRETDDCPMYWMEWLIIDEGDGFTDNDYIVHDYTTDDGYCHYGERKGGDDE